MATHPAHARFQAEGGYLLVSGRGRRTVPGSSGARARSDEVDPGGRRPRCGRSRSARLEDVAPRTRSIHRPGRAGRRGSSPSKGRGCGGGAPAVLWETTSATALRCFLDREDPLVVHKDRPELDGGAVRKVRDAVAALQRGCRTSEHG